MILTRMVCKVVFRSLLKNLIRLLDIDCFESKEIQYEGIGRLYSPSFKLPPVYDQVFRKQQCADFFPFHCFSIYSMYMYVFLVKCVYLFVPLNIHVQSPAMEEFFGWEPHPI